MKSLRFLYLSTLLLTNNAIKPEQENNDIEKTAELKQFSPFEQLKAKIKEIAEENYTNEGFVYFERTHKTTEQIEKDLENTHTTTIQNLKNAAHRINTEHERLITLAETDKKNQEALAQKDYDVVFDKHKKALPTLSIDDQEKAINDIREKAAALTKAFNQFKTDYIAIKTLLEVQKNLNFMTLADQEATTQQEYNQAQKSFYDIQSLMHDHENNALIAAQKAHVIACQARDFDETYTTAQQPSTWSSIWAGYDNYSYRAHENLMECIGCIKADGHSINDSLKKKMSPEAFESLAMTAWVMKKSHAEDGYDHEIGTQICRKTGNTMLCKTIQDDLNKSLEANDQLSTLADQA